MTRFTPLPPEKLASALVSSLNNFKERKLHALREAIDREDTAAARGLRKDFASTALLSHLANAYLAGEKPDIEAFSKLILYQKETAFCRSAAEAERVTRDTPLQLTEHDQRVLRHAEEETIRDVQPLKTPDMVNRGLRNAAITMATTAGVGGGAVAALLSNQIDIFLTNLSAAGLVAGYAVGRGENKYRSHLQRERSAIPSLPEAYRALPDTIYKSVENLIGRSQIAQKYYNDMVPQRDR